MKLYRKKLSGLQDLEREKIRLRYQKLHLDQMHAGQAEGGGKAAEAGLLATVLEMAGDSGATSTAFQIGRQLMQGLGRRRKKRRLAEGVAELPKEKSTARKIFDDIFWSYIVGKAVRVSAGILKDTMSKRKASAKASRQVQKDKAQIRKEFSKIEKRHQNI